MEQLSPTVSLDGQKVKKIREEKGLTQLYVATVIGVTTDTISRWENKRYPNIKRENAIKLAEALGVELDEILEGQDGEKNSDHTVDESENQLKAQGLLGKNKELFLLAIVFVLGIAVATFYFKLSTPSQMNISVKRYLPERCAINTPFPVVLMVSIKPKAPKTILISEHIPKLIKITKTIPVASNQKEGLVKWLFQGDISDKKFTYIAIISPKIKNKKYLKFKGKITIKSDRAISIETSGNEKIKIEQVHWADKDANFIIDDEEILDVYDLLSGVNNVQKLLKDIERLWAAGGYYWDKKRKAFYPITDKSKKGT